MGCVCCPSMHMHQAGKIALHSARLSPSRGHEATGMVGVGDLTTVLSSTWVPDHLLPLGPTICTTKEKKKRIPSSATKTASSAIPGSLA